MEKYTKNRNDTNRETLYEEAIQLLKENGQISTSLLQRQLYIGYSIASEIFERMETEGMIKRQGYLGVITDKAGEIFLKIGDEKYSVSNSWNHLFICENDSIRTELVTSVMEQLKNRNISSKLISFKPELYQDSLKADHFSAPVVRSIIKKMEKRYDAICNSESRNYIDHNSNGNEPNIPLHVLVVDGVDQVAGSVKYQRFIENLHCLSMKCRASGIHVIAFVNDLTSENDELYNQFQDPVNVSKQGFFMKGVTNCIMNTLSRKGYAPQLDLLFDKDKGEIQLSIDLEISGHQLSYKYRYNDRAVIYEIKFPCQKDLDLNEHLALLKLFDADKSRCFDSLNDELDKGYFSLTGQRWDHAISSDFIALMVEEMSKLNIVRKLEEIST